MPYLQVALNLMIINIQTKKQRSSLAFFPLMGKIEIDIK